LSGALQPWASGYADTIRVGADTWYPFNGEPTSEKPGYMIEVAQLVFAEAGHKLEYQVVPWARAVLLVEEGTIEGLVGASPGEVPKLIFPSLPMGKITFGLFTLAEGTWNYSGVDSLGSVVLGHITAYSYGETLNGYIEQYEKATNRIHTLAGNSPLEQGIKMLKLGRITALVSTPEVLYAELDRLSIPKMLVRKAGQMPESDDVFIAFTPANPKSREYARILDDGVKRLRQDGRLQQILSRYGLTDWEAAKPAQAETKP